MYLSKDSKMFLDKMIEMKPDMPNGFRSREKFFSEMGDYDGTIESAIGVLDSLENNGLIKYGDKEHTAFRLLEDGRAYEELEGLRKKDKWIERLWGFAAGIVTTVVAGYLLFTYGWN